MGSFENKVIWIIGASSGFGEALARQFSQQRAKLILSARREALLEQLIKPLPQAKMLVLDLEHPEQFSQLTMQAISLYGQIDMVIFAGAVAQNSPALTTSETVSQKILQIDYISYTQISREIIPHFISRNRGQIIVISGLLAHIHLPGRSTYAAAKAALLGYFGCLRLELLPHHIDVTLLIPGALHTELASKALQGDGSILNQNSVLTGCDINKAARQAIKKIEAKVYQAYIGEQDKAYILWRISQFLPNVAIKLLIKQWLSKK